MKRNEWICEGNELRRFLENWTVVVSLGSPFLVCLYEGNNLSKAYRSFRRDSLAKSLSLANEMGGFKEFGELKKALDKVRH